MRPAPWDHQPPTTNRRQPPASTHHLPPTTTNHHHPPIPNHQPPPTTTNRHQPPVANCQPPTAHRQHMVCPRAFLGKVCATEHFFFPLRTALIVAEAHGSSPNKGRVASEALLVAESVDVLGNEPVLVSSDSEWHCEEHPLTQLSLKRSIAKARESYHAAAWAAPRSTSRFPCESGLVECSLAG